MSSELPKREVALPSFREAFPEYIVEPPVTQCSILCPVPQMRAGSSCLLHDQAQNSVGTLGHGIPSPSRSLMNREDTHREKRFICQDCDKRFSRPSGLATHMNSHTGDKPFECAFPGCGKRYSTRSNMQRHLRVHSESQERPSL